MKPMLEERLMGSTAPSRLDAPPPSPFTNCIFEEPWWLDIVACDASPRRELSAPFALFVAAEIF